VVGKLHRRWDQAQTPCQRLVASGTLAKERQKRLADLYASTNPRQLRDEIYQTKSTRQWKGSGKVPYPLLQLINRRRHSSGNILECGNQIFLVTFLLELTRTAADIL